MLLPTAYFGPVFLYSLYIHNPNYELETKEHFIKQSYRNRCEIYGANGKLNLVVPIQRWKNHTPTEEIKISKGEDWQSNHWKSICSAYRCSPYFEFYEEELGELFFKQFDLLIDLNSFIEAKMIMLLKMNISPIRTEHYTNCEEDENDYRHLIHPKNNLFWSKIKFPQYMQVFASKYGYIENLSILDLLFNIGPNSLDYLKNLNKEHD